MRNRRSLTTVAHPEFTTVIHRRFDWKVKYNWLGRACLFLGPLLLVVGLVLHLWVPAVFGFGVPTYVVGAVGTLLLLAVAHLNSRMEIQP